MGKTILETTFIHVIESRDIRVHSPNGEDVYISIQGMEMSPMNMGTARQLRNALTMMLGTL